MMRRPTRKDGDFLPPFADNMPTVQIIGTPEQFDNFYRWLESRDRALIKQVVSEIMKMQDDPLSNEPEAAAARYWAGKKMKGNGEPYSVRSFQSWVKQNGEVRMPNGLYSKETARKWLFGEW
jgi:hypothetical protein